MARRWKCGALTALALAILSIPVAGFGQNGTVVVQLPGTPAAGIYHYERFFALTPKGQVYLLQYDSDSHQLIQSNQPVWSMPGVTAIAEGWQVNPNGDLAGAFFAITADRQIYYVDASGAGAARARLISTDAPTDKNAIGYFGCAGMLYTIPSNGVLTTRLIEFDKAHMPAGLSAPIQAGTGWNNVSSPQCVESYGNNRFNQIYATAANGVVVWYRQSSPGMTGWTQRNTDLSYPSHPGLRSGVHVFSENFVLEASYTGGGGTTVGQVTQGVRVAADSDGMNWPQGKTYTGVVSGGASLLDFSQVVDDGYSRVPIG